MRYLFTHILRLGAIALPAAVITAMFLLPDGFDILISKEAVEGVVTFKDIFFLVFGKNLIKRWYMLIIGVILLVLTISYTMGIVEKHLKVGRLSLRRPFSSINTCIAPVTKACSLIIVIYVAYKSLFVCIVRLLVAMFASMPATALAIIIVALNSIAFVAILLLMRPIAFTATTMLVYGYSFKDAFGVAMNLGEQSGKHSLRFAFIFPFLVYIVINVLCGALGLPYVVQVIIHTIMVVLIMQYVIVHILLAMFDLAGLERRDNKRYY